MSSWRLRTAPFYTTNLLASAEQVRSEGRLYAPAGEGRIAAIDPRDTGAVAAVALTADNHEGRTYVLTGPEAITYARVADELSGDRVGARRRPRVGQLLCQGGRPGGARVSGLDASSAPRHRTRSRAERGLPHGDLQFLPHADDMFDVVTGFNSFQFAADPVAALREAGRVAKRGGSVVAVVWGGRSGSSSWF